MRECLLEAPIPCSNVSEFVVGTKGSSNCRSEILGPDGKSPWKYPYPVGEDGQVVENVTVSPYDQEHIDLVTAIRAGKPINEAEATATSPLVAVMGRIASYTGREVTRDEMMSSDLRLGPATYAMGPLDIKAEVPVPGSV